MADNPEVQLREVRLSFADHLFEAEVGEVRTKGKHKGKIPYRNSVNFLIPKSNTALKAAIDKALIEARNAQWPVDPPKIKADKLCLQDGDEVDYAGYAGHWYLSASRTTYGTAEGKAPKRPYRIIDRVKVERDGVMVFPDISLDDDKCRAGDYVNAIVRIWAQDDEDYGKRINASIEAVQFWKVGERFGGGARVDVNSRFDEFDGDDDGDDGLGAIAKSSASGGGVESLLG